MRTYTCSPVACSIDVRVVIRAITSTEADASGVRKMHVMDLWMDLGRGQITRIEIVSPSITLVRCRLFWSNEVGATWLLLPYSSLLLVMRCWPKRPLLIHTQLHIMATVMLKCRALFVFIARTNGQGDSRAWKSISRATIGNLTTARATGSVLADYFPCRLRGQRTT